MEALKCPSCGSPNLTKIDATEYKCLHCDTHSKLSKDQTILMVVQGRACPSCGFGNESGVNYCGNCGSKLIKYCVNCQSEARLDISFCPNCGQNIFVTSKDVDVVLKHVPLNKKLDVIKELRNMYPIELEEAKNLTDKPSFIIRNTNIPGAVYIKSRLERAGAIVEIIGSKR